MTWMEKDFPKKVNSLKLKEAVVATALRKRSIDDKEKVQADDNKPSIKDRIKVREDAKEKKIKVSVAAPATTPANGTESGKPKDEAPTKSAKDPSKVRCNFYPGCKKAECPFVHPKDPVG